LIFYCLIGPAAGWAQDLQVLLRDAAVAEAAMQDDLAYLKYQQALKIQPANITVLCKCSELACKIGHRQASKEAQLRYFETARRYAETALKLNPNYSDANFVMSLSMGRIALVSSGRQLVEAVKGIKVYADKTVALNPADFRGYHVLGKWYYEISNLGTFKRTAVKIFYGAFPDASYEDARRNYQKSMQLNPTFNLNYLELAKVYIKLDRNQEAIAALEKLVVMPLKMEDDQRIRIEGRKLLQELKDDL
jgi:tetratricopeptide (TPR) repeat protein